MTPKILAVANALIVLLSSAAGSVQALPMFFESERYETVAFAHTLPGVGASMLAFGGNAASVRASGRRRATIGIRGSVETA